MNINCHGFYTTEAGKESISLLDKYHVNNIVHIDNIFSISKITKELNCELIFSASRLILQDLRWGGELRLVWLLKVYIGSR